METTTRANGRSEVVARERGRPGRMRRWWRRTLLRRKLLTVAALSMLACVPPIVVAFTLTWRVADVRSETEDTQRLADHLDQLQDALAEADMAIRSYAIGSFDDPQHVEDFQDAAGRVPGLLAAIGDEAPAGLAGPVRGMDAAVRTAVDEMEVLVAFGDPAAVDSGATGGSVTGDTPSASLLDQLLVATDALDAGQRARERVQTLVDDRLAGQRADLDHLASLLGWSIVVGWLAALVIILAGIWLAAGGLVRRIETLSENGQRFLLDRPLLAVPPSRDEIGRLAEGIVIAGKLLDQRRREAVAANRGKDELISRISHELRTPLTAVIGFGQILEEDDELADDERDAARRIVSGGQHLLALINDLLDVSKFDTGHLAVIVGPVRVCDVAHDTAALVRSLADARSIGLDVRCPDADLLVAADPQRLKQVLLNLLSNAIKYNREHGDVTVDVTTPDDRAVRISVTDTGEGIPPDGLARLFQPFERLDAAHTSIEGSGIGLALSKRLVEAMHGTIGVDSTVGTGTTFWVDLPQTVPEESPVGAPVGVGVDRP